MKRMNDMLTVLGEESQALGDESQAGTREKGH
jgi:hypothetical protein